MSAPEGRPQGRVRRVRTPTVLQMEAVECGAAALSSVLAWHGLWLPLEQVRAECGVSRDGSNALSLVRVARAHGLKAEGRRVEVADLGAQRFPAIAFWNFNHFVVVEGFDPRWVFLNDPAHGPRRVRWADFEEAFTGVLITLELTPAFRRGGRPPSLLRQFGHRLRGSMAGWLYVLGASLLAVVPGLISASFISFFVDRILGEGHRRWILWFLLAIALTGAVSGALGWLKAYFLSRLQGRISLRTSASFFWHVLRLPVEFFSQRYSGEIASRVALNDSVAGLLTGNLASAVLNTLMIGFYGVAMAFYDAELTLVAALLAILNFLTLSSVSRVRTDANKRLLSDSGRLLGTTLGGLQTIETLKACGREDDLYARWSGYQARVVNTQQELGVSSRGVQVIPGALSSLGNVLVLGLGGVKVMDGSLTVGMLLAFQSLMGRFLSPVESMVGYGSQLQEAVGDMNRLDDVLRTAPEVAAEEEPGPGPLQKLTGELEFRGVTFGYNRLGPPLIEGFSFRLAPGRRIALIGASGSGKSTVARLASGLYRPWSGEILLAGQPLHSHPPTVRAASLAVVDQDILLFSGTLRENLTLWNDTIPDEALARAVHDAGIEGLVSSRAGGFEALVEEGGANFSGGERQRLEIARALAGDPRLLILDEATSALDPLVEKEIDERLRRRGCSCLIVAHRLSTIRDCDEIILLSKGRVVARGTHEELLAAGGPYRELLAAELGPGGGELP